MMVMYNVREAYQLLKERGIARDKQEVRRWLNEGYIQAETPINRRVGWKIEEEALQSFIQRFENGEFQELSHSCRTTMSLRLKEGGDPILLPNEERTQLIRLEEEVSWLRTQVRGLRRELNDLKKILGFPVLLPAAAPSASEEDASS
jgi:hypothetical protein